MERVNTILHGYVIQSWERAEGESKFRNVGQELVISEDDQIETPDGDCTDITTDDLDESTRLDVCLKFDCHPEST